jgi:hypothetical protein
LLSATQIPAEIFPTRYRCTCHGLSAAAGKLGSLAVQGVLSSHKFDVDPAYFGVILGCFSIVMTLGAILAGVWLPSLQEPPIASTKTCVPPTSPSETLEALAKGREWAISTEARYPPEHPRLAGRLRGGQVLSFEGRYKQIRNRFRREDGYDGRALVEGEDFRVARDVEMGTYTNKRVEPLCTDKGTNGGTLPA